MFRQFRAIALSIGAASVLAGAAHAVQIDIPGPAGSINFGSRVVVLTNGNFVVTDSGGGGAGVGAVYLYDPSGNLISTLKGNSVNDYVGSNVVALSNGNFVVVSNLWNNAGAAAAGAVTWVNGTTGLNGIVTTSNSFVGDSASDGQFLNVTALANGNYVICAPRWSNGSAQVGAITWCDGSAPCVGTAGPGNSLIGSHATDFGDVCRIRPLSNGHFVVANPQWDNGSNCDAGAVTWMNGGARSPVGLIGSGNSLVGSSPSDVVGNVTVLSNGNYVVGSQAWDDASVAETNNGAATWCNGSTAGPRCTGAVSRSNSLYGGTTNDKVGYNIVALSNGNYVVESPFAANGAMPQAGAVTWGNGTTGRTGLVAPGNSLVGAHADDFIGHAIALSNGHYVVRSPAWDSTTRTDAGAVTWGDGSSGLTGTISAANSLVGTYDQDRVGEYVLPLKNGHYVVCSPLWNDFGIIDLAGAATWGNGSTAGPRTTGSVTATNSLYGSANSQIGSSDCGVALDNGNYVIGSQEAFNGKGAATWSDGNSGLVGLVSAANSFTGNAAGDHVGEKLFALARGNYVAVTPALGGGSAFGAVTWSRGNKALVGSLGVANSLVGSAPGDALGSGGIKTYADGAYVVYSPDFHVGVTSVGAFTVGNSAFRLKGLVDANNSMIGAVFNNGDSFSYGYDPTHAQLVVGRRNENLVTLFKSETIFPDSFDE